MREYLIGVSLQDKPENIVEWRSESCCKGWIFDLFPTSVL